MSARAIIASRSGELRTVDHDEAERLTTAGGWILICREPEGATPPAHSTPGAMRLLLDVKHWYCRTPDEECPQPAYIDVPASLDYWTTDTLADITERASAMLEAERISWTLHTKETAGGRRKTEIDIVAWSKNGNGQEQHRIEINLPGFPVFAVAEMLRHVTFELTYNYRSGGSYHNRRPRPAFFLDMLRRVRRQLDKLDDELDDLEGHGGVDA